MRICRLQSRQVSLSILNELHRPFFGTRPMTSPEAGALEAEEQALQHFLRALQNTESAEARQAGLDFEPRPGDVMVVTPPKSGTTMVQQVSMWKLTHTYQSTCRTQTLMLLALQSMAVGTRKDAAIFVSGSPCLCVSQSNVH